MFDRSQSHRSQVYELVGHGITGGIDVRWLAGPGDQPDSLGLVGVQRAPPQTQVQRSAPAQQPGHTLRPAPGRQQAALDLGQTDAGLAPGHDSEVTGQGQLAAAPQGVPGNDRHGGLGQPLPPPERRSQDG